ncbi:serine protease snake-like [Ischnura elegans]|uniref:serine protease snake-like n=1 Tax=Ischnura elegans TaxID=197161 RepID=UPI001ED89943|nr:serine protease snake-like [Ischnura elegans]
MGRGESRVYILGICIVYCVVVSYAQFFPGDQCTDSSNSRGVCRSFSDCPTAMDELMRGIRPVTCGFNRRQPIVCCPRGNAMATSLTTSSPTPTPPQTTLPSKLPPTAPTVRPLPDEAATDPDPPITTTLPSTNPGDRARAWCKKYSEVCPFYLHDAGPYEFPHLASVGYGPRGNIKWKCGGSLISENFVLTAAHCLNDGPDGPPQWVLLGVKTLTTDESPLDKSGQIHLIMQRIKHTDYKSTEVYHDIALLKIGPAIAMDAKSTLSVELHPACLMTEETSNFPSLVATGWGSVGFGENPNLNLLKVELNVLDEANCNETIEARTRTTSRSRRSIHSKMICAGVRNGSSNTCKGDSGGPLQAPKSGKCQYSIYGIVSHERLCFSADKPSIFTKISAHIEWIESIVWPVSSS